MSNLRLVTNGSLTLNSTVGTTYNVTAVLKSDSTGNDFNGNGIQIGHKVFTRFGNLYTISAISFQSISGITMDITEEDTGIVDTSGPPGLGQVFIFDQGIALGIPEVLFNNITGAPADLIAAAATYTSRINELIPPGGDVFSTDTDASSYAFVIDEDDLISDDDTKVPTQQSVKAYIDGKSILLDAAVSVFSTINPSPSHEYIFTSSNNARQWNFDFLNFNVGEFITLQSTPEAGTIEFIPLDNGVQNPNTAERIVFLEPGAIYKAYKLSVTPGDIKVLKVSAKNYSVVTLTNNVVISEGNFYRKLNAGAPVSTEAINIDTSRLTSGSVFYIQNFEATTTTLTADGGTTLFFATSDVASSSTSITFNAGDILEINVLNGDLYYTCIKETVASNSLATADQTLTGHRTISDGGEFYTLTLDNVTLNCNKGNVVVSHDVGVPILALDQSADFGTASFGPFITLKDLYKEWRIGMFAGSFTIEDENEINGTLIEVTPGFTGTVNFFKDVSLDGNKIVDLAEPTLATDAATKNYVDSLQTSSLATADQAITGTRRITSGTGSPQALVIDAGNLSLEDNPLFITAAVGFPQFTMRMDADFGANTLGPSIVLEDVYQKWIIAMNGGDINIIDDTAATTLINITKSLDAIEIFKNISLQNNKIIDLADPVVGTDAVNKNYADNLPSNNLATTDQVLTGKRTISGGFETAFSATPLTIDNADFKVTHSAAIPSVKISQTLDIGPNAAGPFMFLEDVNQQWRVGMEAGSYVIAKGNVANDVRFEVTPGATGTINFYRDASLDNNKIVNLAPATTTGNAVEYDQWQASIIVDELWNGIATSNIIVDFAYTISESATADASLGFTFADVRVYGINGYTAFSGSDISFPPLLADPTFYTKRVQLFAKDTLNDGIWQERLYVNTKVDDPNTLRTNTIVRRILTDADALVTLENIVGVHTVTTDSNIVLSATEEKQHVTLFTTSTATGETTANIPPAQFSRLGYEIIVTSSNDTGAVRDNRVSSIATDIRLMGGIDLASVVIPYNRTYTLTCKDVGAGVYRWILDVGDDPSAFTGWASYVDEQYVVGSSFNLVANTEVVLPNNALTSLSFEQPIDITSFYDPATLSILGRKGDGISLIVEFIAVPGVGADYLDISVDIGGAVGKVYPDTKTFPKGQGVARNIIYQFTGYTLDTWEANGGQVKVVSNGPVSIYDIRYVITRTHKARG